MRARQLLSVGFFPSLGSQHQALTPKAEMMYMTTNWHGCRRSILKGPVLASLAFTCSCCSSALAGANQWGYGTEDGPAAWTEICQSGLKQSPINLPVPGKLPVYTGSEELGIKNHSMTSKPVCLALGHRSYPIACIKIFLMVVIA